MQNRLTIKDIARLSGVGKSTVSRVLNNESGVSERTRERVEAVMNQHGFSPSRSARAMRGQSDKVVAIIVSRLDSLSENLAVQTMLPAFYEQGYDPIMMESQFSPQMVEEHLGMLQRRNIDGVVLFGFTGIQEEMLKPWQPSLVLLARDASGFASVCYDDEGAIITLMQRLYDAGHRHISFLGVPHADVTTGKRRHEAYLAFCKKHNLSAVASLPGLGMKQGYEQVASVLTPQTTALVRTVDGWFGDKPFAASGGQVSGYLRLGGLWKQHDGTDVHVRFRLRAHLPNLQDKAYVFIGRDNEAEEVKDQPDTFTREALLQRPIHHMPIQPHVIVKTVNHKQRGHWRGIRPPHLADQIVACGTEAPQLATDRCCALGKVQPVKMLVCQILTR